MLHCLVIISQSNKEHSMMKVQSFGRRAMLRAPSLIENLHERVLFIGRIGMGLQPKCAPALNEATGKGHERRP